jgi:hypothetical protein
MGLERQLHFLIASGTEIMHKFVASAATALVCAFAVPVRADIVVVVNKANTQAIDMIYVTKMYAGTTLTWSDGSAITLLDQRDDAVRTEFAKAIGKTVGNLKAVWTNLMFSGKAVPPKVMSSDAEVKAAVSADKAAIGYINASSIDETVKVIK